MSLAILKLKLFDSRNIFQELLDGCFQRIVIPSWRDWARPYGVPTCNEPGVHPFDDRWMNYVAVVDW